MAAGGRTLPDPVDPACTACAGKVRVAITSEWRSSFPRGRDVARLRTPSLSTEADPPRSGRPSRPTLDEHLVSDDMHLIHPEHPPADPGSLNPASPARRQVDRFLSGEWITFRTARPPCAQTMQSADPNGSPAGGAWSPFDEIRASQIASLGLSGFLEVGSGSLQDLGMLYAALDYMTHLEGEKHMVFVTEQGLKLFRADYGTFAALKPSRVAARRWDRAHL
jgi:hypothetical protein